MIEGLLFLGREAGVGTTDNPSADCDVGQYDAQILVSPNRFSSWNFGDGPVLAVD